MYFTNIGIEQSQFKENNARSISTGNRVARKKAAKRLRIKKISYKTTVIILLFLLTTCSFSIVLLIQELSNIKARVYNASIPEVERLIILGI